MSFTTTIGTQKTPANPVDVLLGPQQGLPNAQNTLILIGAMGPTGGPSGGGSASGTSLPYNVITINNVGSVSAASGECVTKFGNNSVLTNMVLAAVAANASASSFPPIKAIPLPQGASNFGTTNQALTALDNQQCSYVATQFDGSTDTANRTALLTEVQAMSGAQRTSNAQYGTTAIMANTSNATPSSLPQTNSQFFMGVYMYDSSGANPYNVGQIAAASAAVLAANPRPYNGLDSVAVPGITAPSNIADWISVGGGATSEVVLNQGWTPLRVLPNGTVAFVRTVSGRTFLSDGVTPVTSYIDQQDFQVLYDFRATVATRFAQPDFQNQKASQGAAKRAKGEVIKMMQTFQDLGMFQAVSQLAPLVQVQTNTSQRGRFDVYIPVNVVPNLHEIATDIVAGTLFDSFTV